MQNEQRKKKNLLFLFSYEKKVTVIKTMSSADLIIEYSSNPPNKGILDHANIRYRETNRVCADVVEVFLVIEDGILRQFSFDGYMSIIATACVSITGEILE
jgi:NifU-like protein involved in Fe-S cluster formation